CRPYGAGAGRAHDIGGVALPVPTSPSNHRRGARQPTPVSTHIRHGHDPRWHQLAGADATHGSCPDPNHADLRSTHFTGRVSAVRTGRGTAHPTPAGFVRYGKQTNSLRRSRELTHLCFPEVTQAF